MELEISIKEALMVMLAEIALNCKRDPVMFHDAGVDADAVLESIIHFCCMSLRDRILSHEHFVVGLIDGVLDYLLLDVSRIY